MTAKVIHLTIKTTKAKTQKKPKRPIMSARDTLLMALRVESRARQWSSYSMKERTPLVDLARAAAHSPKRSITWHGIRFPLRHSLFLTVLDPETGKPLISTNGGAL